MLSNHFRMVTWFLKPSFLGKFFNISKSTYPMNYHLMIDDKFIDDFILDSEYINSGNNIYLLQGTKANAKYVKSAEVTFVECLSIYLKELKNRINLKDQVFIHWLHDEVNDFVLSLPEEIKIGLFFWGGDIVDDPEEAYINDNLEPISLRYFNEHLHSYNSYWEIKRNPFDILRHAKRKYHFDGRIKLRLKSKYLVLARLNFFLHWNRLDYEWIQSRVQNFKAEFVYHFYRFGLDKNLPIPDRVKNAQGNLVFWLGNSATITNNHLDAFELLSCFRDANIDIYCPLSYGEKPNGFYTKDIKKFGHEFFGKRFQPLLQFLPRNEYYELFKRIDIVVMFHNRTQAAGNIASFLQMGKKVFLQNKSTIYQLLRQCGAIVFENKNLLTLNIDELKEPLSNEEIIKNQYVINKCIFNLAMKQDSLERILH